MRPRTRPTALVPLVASACLVAGATGVAPAAAAPAAPAAVAAPVVQRIAGSDRYLTAVEASRAAFGDGEAQAVVLARSDAFADSLAAGPLASDRGGPLLLTTPGALVGSVGAEIRRVLAPGGTVYLLGGPGALSPAVESAVAALGARVQRVAGSDRYATAVEVARLLPGASNAALVTGLDFPDGLAAGALMGVEDGGSGDAIGAVLLTKGDVVPAVTRDFLVQRGFADTGYIVPVGGAAVRAAQTLPARETGALLPLAGGNRYDTAARVAGQFLSTGSFFSDAGSAAGVATGENWPDALAGSALMGFAAGPLLLTRRASLPVETTDALRRLAADARGSGGITTALVFGGAGAVAPEQDAAIGAALS